VGEHEQGLAAGVEAPPAAAELVAALSEQVGQLDEGAV
jgi:hypothetical protein